MALAGGWPDRPVEPGPGLPSPPPRHPRERLAPRPRARRPVHGHPRPATPPPPPPTTSSHRSLTRPEPSSPVGGWRPTLTATLVPVGRWRPTHHHDLRARWVDGARPTTRTSVPGGCLGPDPPRPHPCPARARGPTSTATPVPGPCMGPGRQVARCCTDLVCREPGTAPRHQPALAVEPSAGYRVVPTAVRSQGRRMGRTWGVCMAWVWSRPSRIWTCQPRDSRSARRLTIESAMLTRTPPQRSS